MTDMKEYDKLKRTKMWPNLYADAYKYRNKHPENTVSYETYIESDTYRCFVMQEKDRCKCKNNIYGTYSELTRINEGSIIDDGNKTLHDRKYLKSFAEQKKDQNIDVKQYCDYMHTKFNI